MGPFGYSRGGVVGGIRPADPFAITCCRRLNQQEVAQLLRITSSFSPSADVVEAIPWRTEGNPLFVTEVVGAWPQLDQDVDPESIAGIPEGIREDDRSSLDSD